ncbi:hypothetical protein IL992_30710 [Microbispora sp. NEAU-D428]|uniref:hypothetical protein n=1 Tax=Microbispora sitophila TaxID=2771537 RepID=UPI0018695CD0|nr:hypothetical protein [Microbispora sitophila]MBE3013517.1 hypothetical protein [Microbispora sitophila]
MPSVLVRILGPDDRGADESLWVTTEGVLGLLELAGPEKVLKQLRAMAGASPP